MAGGHRRSRKAKRSGVGRGLWVPPLTAVLRAGRSWGGESRLRHAFLLLPRMAVWSPGVGVETPLAFTKPRHLPGASLPADTLPPPQLRVGRWLSEQPALRLPSAPFPPPMVVATFPASRSVCLQQHTPDGSCCFTPAWETGLWGSAEGRRHLPVGEKPLPLQLPTGARPRPRRPHLERTPCSARRAGTRCCGTGLAGPVLGWTPRWVMQSLQCLGYGRNALVSCARSGVLFLVTATPPPNIPKCSTLGP